jgi:hypothetical protein
MSFGCGFRDEGFDIARASHRAACDAVSGGGAVTALEEFDAEPLLPVDLPAQRQPLNA